jgi:aryl-alcohol dehydrogenase-like predicted oxidoreductase
MELRRLGTSELTVSVVGLGCNNFGRVVDLAGTRAVVDAALDVGITFLDTAESYGGGDSERFLGEALRGRRADVVLATKFGGGVPGGGSAGYIRKAVEASLERLQTDYVDLLYYHRPDGRRGHSDRRDARCARRARRRGQGPCDRLLKLQRRAARRGRRGPRNQEPLLRAAEPVLALLERNADADVLPLCRELDVGFVAYFPLASGLLTGKYRRGEAPAEGTRLARGAGELLSDGSFDEVDRLAAFAEGRGHSLHELAIASVTSTPGVASALVGATSPEQARDNAAVNWRLSPEELDAIPRVEGRGVHRR